MSHNFNKNLEWSVLQMNLKEKEKKATTKKKKNMLRDVSKLIFIQPASHSSEQYGQSILRWGLCRSVYHVVHELT